MLDAAEPIPERLAASLGAGTVLDAEAARACMEAGARFVVSPALDLETVACCRERGVAVLPGALTPTEVLRAWTAGADLVKVFPAGALGGASYVKSLKAPLPQVELVPTGGVSLKTPFGTLIAPMLGVASDRVGHRIVLAGMRAIYAAVALPGPARVTIENFTFKAPALSVPVGTTVTWKNEDDSPHRIGGKGGTFTSAALDTDDTFARTFTTPGEYSYICTIHPYMVGKIIVIP